MEYSNADATHELTQLIEARIIAGIQEPDIRKELGWCIDDAFDTAIGLLLPSVLERFKRETLKECPWCGKPCPDAHKPQGCWFPDCPDEPHA